MVYLLVVAIVICTSSISYSSIGDVRVVEIGTLRSSGTGGGLLINIRVHAVNLRGSMTSITRAATKGGQAATG